MKIAIAVLVGILALGGGGWWWYSVHYAGPAATFRTAELARGEMVPTISATGTLEPLDSIDVGAQVAGQIVAFGNDRTGKPIDYRSPVEAGDLLATIDKTLYDADYKTAAATRDAAKAQLKSAEATCLQYKAQLVNAKSVWERAQKLRPSETQPSEAISENDYQTAKAAFGVAEANVQLGEALKDQANAMVSQDEAQLSKAQKNLDYCVIKAPVRGVIIDRRVNVGQTVVSSLNAPSLFLIAKDLTQIQVWVSVNEADIDKVYPGQPVTFTVDAFPGEIFKGSVGKVRLNAQMTQNVVTYTVEVNTDNSEGRLYPYMTANVQFEITRHKDAMLIPNAALRWYPQPEMVAPEVRAEMKEKKNTPEPADPESPESQRRKRRPTTGPSTRPVKTEPHGRGTIWVTDGKFVRPVKVKTSYTDGVNTEISFKDNPLPLGTQIVLGEIHAQTADSGTTNPFAPQWGRGRGH